ncbi:metallophosphoesterase, partial [Ruminococcus sp.]|uniref:metallophosphoesterase n=1 Tax=Ruminococcus sp. TaxID=41978 RepID=UPI0039A19794
MVYITGDMHGDLSRFKNPIFKKLKAGDVLIVCGDFGFIWDGSRQEKQNLKKLREMPFTIAFVDGCHENFDILEQSFRTVRWRGGRAHLIAPNIFHMMRGEIFTIDDRTFFAFGGGHSQDFEFRQGRNWWQREQPTHAEIRRAIHNLNEHNAQVDYSIT